MPTELAEIVPLLNAKQKRAGVPGFDCPYGFLGAETYLGGFLEDWLLYE